MILHHPSEETLAAYASGALHAGAALTVACHVDACPVCRNAMRTWNGLGGTLLTQASPASLSDGALERALAALDRSATGKAKPSLPDFLARFDLPERLKSHAIGARQWLAPGIWFAPIGMEEGARARTYFVYGDKNRTLPRHTHEAREFTAVLSGSYCDDLGRFEAGDFAETSETDRHAPGVTADKECLCLLSSDGPMRLESFAARMIQTLAGRRY